MTRQTQHPKKFPDFARIERTRAAVEESGLQHPLSQNKSECGTLEPRNSPLSSECHIMFGLHYSSSRAMMMMVMMMVMMMMCSHYL